MTGMTAKQFEKDIKRADMIAEAQQLAETIASYRMNIRYAVRGLWTGHLDYDQFFDDMILAIRRGFTQA